jgi:hypothetical protein
MLHAVEMRGVANVRLKMGTTLLNVHRRGGNGVQRPEAGRAVARGLAVLSLARRAVVLTSWCG